MINFIEIKFLTIDNKPIVTNGMESARHMSINFGQQNGICKVYRFKPYVKEILYIKYKDKPVIENFIIKSKTDVIEFKF